MPISQCPLFAACLGHRHRRRSSSALHGALPDYPHTNHPPYPRLLEYDVSDNPLRDQLLTEPLEPIDGAISVPAGPGLGVDVDPEAIARYRLD